MSGPTRKRPWDSVLDLWQAGQPGRTIAETLGLTSGDVRSIVHLSRKRGDPRAIRRRAPSGQPGTGSVQGGAWVPYWADPAQIPLPLPEGAAP